MISNVELWNAVRRHNPSFAAHTAEGTAELFSERGWSTITQAGTQIINEFWSLAMPYYLNIINVSKAQDPLETNGFGERYEQAWGEYTQRMAVDSIKPITPAYRNLNDGKGPDPFVVRKPKTSDRFFRQNFVYQSLVTLPDEWMTKRIFISEYGFGEFLAGVSTGLENGYIIQKFTNKLEAINGGLLHNADSPLKHSQIVVTEMADKPTIDQLVDFQRSVMNTVEIMTTSAQTGAYNQLGWESTQDKSRLHLLVRPGYQANLALDVVRGSYNADTLNLGVQIDVVPHFGGLVPYKEASFTTQLYPVYDDIGAQIGWNTAADQKEVTVQLGKEFYKDPNEDVYAILADKGLVFEMRKNDYRVETIRNPYGLYNNLWASAPNNGIFVDPLYNAVVFKTKTPAGK